MEGRSTSKINGETVPISLLKEAAAILIDIHGQHEHQSLLYKKRQLELLDAFASEKILEAKEKRLPPSRSTESGKKSWRRLIRTRQSGRRKPLFSNLR